MCALSCAFGLTARIPVGDTADAFDDLNRLSRSCSTPAFVVFHSEGSLAQRVAGNPLPGGLFHCQSNLKQPQPGLFNARLASPRADMKLCRSEVSPSALAESVSRFATKMKFALRTVTS